MLLTEGISGSNWLLRHSSLCSPFPLTFSQFFIGGMYSVLEEIFLQARHKPMLTVPVNSSSDNFSFAHALVYSEVICKLQAMTNTTMATALRTCLVMVEGKTLFDR